MAQGDPLDAVEPVEAPLSAEEEAAWEKATAGTRPDIQPSKMPADPDPWITPERT